jgi:hypothetical protein
MLHPDEIDRFAHAFRLALLSTAAPKPADPEPEPKPAEPVTEASPLDVARLPEYAVVTREHAAALLGTSVDTLKRLARRGEGPTRVRVSTKCIGYRISDLRAWVAQLASV